MPKTPAHLPHLETIVTIEFFDRGNSTEVVLTHVRIAADEVRVYFGQGWDEEFEKLLEDLRGARDRLNQNASNSSRPPGSHALWKYVLDIEKRESGLEVEFPEYLSPPFFAIFIDNLLSLLISLFRNVY